MPSKFERVHNSQAYPWAAIVSIIVTYDDGSQSRGSGAVVGNNDVLTSAHVVEPDGGRQVASIEIKPGYNGGPITESYEASRWRWYEVDADGDGLLSPSEVQRDYALLTVETPRPLGDEVGWFGLQANAVPARQEIFLNTAGYPGGFEDPFGDPRMARGSGYEYYDGTVIEHDYEHDTGLDVHGASGSPLYFYEDGGPLIAGILSTSVSATFISTRVFDDIMDWMWENDPHTLHGGRGDNRLAGGFKDDRIFGGGGDDTLRGGDGDDRLDGQGGNDVAIGGGGRDRLEGGIGQDRLEGGGGDDRLAGWDASDRLLGGAGRDTLLGGPGADLIDGGRGRDIAFGGLSADVFCFRRGDGLGNVVHDFQAGIDTLELAAGLRFSDIAISRSGADTVVRFLDVSLIVDGLRPLDLHRSDFDLA